MRTTPRVRYIACHRPSAISFHASTLQEGAERIHEPAHTARRPGGRREQMKATSSVVDLAETALPIFGDPERDYDYLVGLREYTPIEGGVEAEVESYEGRAARVRL